jgi:hypothetical protein
VGAPYRAEHALPNLAQHLGEKARLCVCMSVCARVLRTYVHVLTLTRTYMST